MRLQTEILIHAPAHLVWQALTAYTKYSEWNPFIKKIEGQVEKGQKIHVELGGMKFNPMVLNFDPETEFRWKGKLFIKGIFDGEHFFQLQSQENGSTMFTHGEIFTGLLVPIFKKKLFTETKSQFEQMNVALKKRAEAMANE